MNSVAKYLTPETIVATLLAMRSGRKEIFLIVEGGTDISLYESVLGLPRSNFVSCGGKGLLTKVFELAPTRGLDAGTIFLRDRDCDDVTARQIDDVVLLFSDLYDVEMHLLSGRLFGRIFKEYMGIKAAENDAKNAYEKILDAANCLGLLRKYSHEKLLFLDFENLRFDFLDAKTLTVDQAKMITKVFARSKKSLASVEDVQAQLEALRLAAARPEQHVRGKDFLSVFHIALDRYFDCCASAECAPDVLARALRIGAELGDLRETPFVRRLAARISEVPFAWAGADLASAS